jgi:predicted N-acetyltransferase YhbS
MTADAVIHYRSDRKIDAATFKDILQRSGLAERRPVGDMVRLERMLQAYNLIITAYLADLAVTADMQRCGIGRRLVDLARAMVGPQVTLILLSAPAAVDYYPKIGMERFKDCFIFRRSE